MRKFGAGYLRKKYPRFVYKSFGYRFSGKNLEADFEFAVNPDIHFSPKVTIKDVDKGRVEQLKGDILDNLVFHLGLIEIPSYWKATCSPEIVVEAGYLDVQQKKWWKDLLIHGMGEYFYVNKIDFTKRGFLTISSCGPSNKQPLPLLSLKDRALVPHGGGKDSIVTFELLRGKVKLRPFLSNPKPHTLKTLKLVGAQDSVVVRRHIDPFLLKLNRNGYLNGHTPFSAYLAFVSTVSAILFNYKYVVLSNERSSSEGNVRYRGRMINHQYSKSFRFEKMFRQYAVRHLAKDVAYFSFLRPLYELQIAQLFARFPKYFPHFLSCNDAYKTRSGAKQADGRWCGMCPKCLFVYAALYPFVEKSKLVKVFGKNLFEDKSLIPLLEELSGARKFKPFECVGTTDESRAAFYLALEKEKTYSSRLPVLLRGFNRRVAPLSYKLHRESKKILIAWGQNFLPGRYARILERKVSTV